MHSPSIPASRRKVSGIGLPTCGRLLIGPPRTAMGDRLPGLSSWITYRSGHAKTFAILAARQAGRPVLLAIALLLGTAGCSRIVPKNAAKPEPQRFAILRFENLSAGSEADWIGRALAEVLSAELSGAPGLSVISTGELHSFDRNLGANGPLKLERGLNALWTKGGLQYAMPIR